ncbi:BON1-associated protein 2-like [Rhodamnia argentea]|uniref:BON1-associated protein 2-like n=1 Tax=Rhodamnia argentea TaxID=178133 RepID=A0A8B8PFA3_9MYRT|nr:BON1-associated protein 2-like [Rhodamnia argentea]
MKRALEITLISGENLRLNKKPVKNAVAVVRVEPGRECSTKPAPEKGTNPEWNENLVVDLPQHAGFITVEVKCKSSSGSYKLIGGATVPVSDFAGDFGAPKGYVQFLSYRLRDSHGVRTDGIINISAKMAAPAAAPAHSYEVPRPEMGVPAGDQRKMVSAGGLVTGVPVWYAQPCRC